MKLRAQITIDLDAADYVDAADHQRRFQNLLQTVKQQYPQAECLFRERRVRPAVRQSSPPPKVRRQTGRLHQYEEH
jgi:hypothetical protein